MSRSTMTVLLALSMFLLASTAHAELATEEQAALVAGNWLTYVVSQAGDWAGSDRPRGESGRRLGRLRSPGDQQRPGDYRRRWATRLVLLGLAQRSRRRSRSDGVVSCQGVLGRVQRCDGRRPGIPGPHPRCASGSPRPLRRGVRESRCGRASIGRGSLRPRRQGTLGPLSREF